MSPNSTLDTILSEAAGATLNGVGAPPFNDAAFRQALARQAAADVLTKAGRLKPCRLSPMDEALWFQQPLSRNVPIPPSTPIVIAVANPNRVALIISNGVQGDVVVGPTPVFTPAAIIGLILPQASMPLMLNQDQYGYLVQCEWSAWQATVNTQSLGVLEVLLRGWPGE